MQFTSISSIEYSSNEGLKFSLQWKLRNWKVSAPISSRYCFIDAPITLERYTGTLPDVYKRDTYRYVLYFRELAWSRMMASNRDCAHFSTGSLKEQMVSPLLDSLCFTVRMFTLIPIDCLNESWNSRYVHGPSTLHTGRHLLQWSLSPAECIPYYQVS